MIQKFWRLLGGYTFFKRDIGPKPGHAFNGEYLANDSRNKFIIQSMLDLPFNLEFDLTGRYHDGLPQTFATVDVPAYFTFDARIGFELKGFELSIVGQNLAEKNHTEFGTFYIPRHIYGKISARF